MSTGAVEIVARFSGARRIPVMMFGPIRAARWGVNTGIDTWHGIIEAANYQVWFLGDDGLLRLDLPEGIPGEFIGQEVLGVSYRAKFEGCSKHFRHRFRTDHRPRVAWDAQEKILTLSGGGYKVTPSGIIG